MNKSKKDLIIALAKIDKMSSEQLYDNLLVMLSKKKEQYDINSNIAIIQNVLNLQQKIKNL
jgi:hypothetical protein